MKKSVSKVKFACLCSRWLGKYVIFELCNQISSQKREKICETVLACSYGAQVKSFKQKIVKDTPHRLVSQLKHGTVP